MKYERIQVGRFIERPNRFIAYVEIEGMVEMRGTAYSGSNGLCAGK